MTEIMTVFMTAFMTVFMIHDYLKPLFENVLLKHGGLPHDPMFSLLLSDQIFLYWASRGGHSKSLFLFEFSCWRPLPCIKVGGWWVDFSDSLRGQIPLYLIGFEWDWDLVLGLSIYYEYPLWNLWSRSSSPSVLFLLIVLLF